MQRIGRVDRRMNADTEARILADHPEQEAIRGHVAFWNFLPPKDLDEILKLYKVVSRKTLRISKVFGIEGKKLLTPEDDYEALKDFYHTYEGDTTPLEELHLEYHRLLNAYPELMNRLETLPNRIFSGREHPTPEAKAVFFCYALPAPVVKASAVGGKPEAEWVADAGESRWYLYDLTTETIVEAPAQIARTIRCAPETPRRCQMARRTLSEIRARIDKRIKDTYLKSINAPQGVTPPLKAWMELS
jgi:hypothetical protein